MDGSVARFLLAACASMYALPQVFSLETTLSTKQENTATFFLRKENVLCALALSVWSFQVDSMAGAADALARQPLNERAFSPELAGKWIGPGVSYGPFRDGQAPGAALCRRARN